MTLVKNLAAAGASICALMVSACAIEKLDMDTYLNRSVGKPLSEAQFDENNDPRRRVLLAESATTQTYRYSVLGPVACAWTVEIDKKTNLVLGWKYVSREAEDSCRNLVARRGA